MSGAGGGADAAGGLTMGDHPGPPRVAGGGARPRLSLRAFLVLAVALAVGLAFAVAPHASSRPDGLERVAADHGFLGQGSVHALQEQAPVPDYAAPGIGAPWLATGLAGFGGTLLVLAIGCGIGLLLRRR